MFYFNNECIDLGTWTLKFVIISKDLILNYLNFNLKYIICLGSFVYSKVILIKKFEYYYFKEKYRAWVHALGIILYNRMIVMF